jgi:hypothetical protein
MSRDEVCGTVLPLDFQPFNGKVRLTTTCYDDGVVSVVLECSTCEFPLEYSLRHPNFLSCPQCAYEISPRGAAIVCDETIVRIRALRNSFEPKRSFWDFLMFWRKSLPGAASKP